MCLALHTCALVRYLLAHGLNPFFLGSKHQKGWGHKRPDSRSSIEMANRFTKLLLSWLQKKPEQPWLHGASCSRPWMLVLQHNQIGTVR
eukprot:726892-Amphidinium_carterae.2